MANRLKLVMEDVIGFEQGAFKPGRDISDNILLAHELVKNYESKWLTPKACIEVDIRRAFDSIFWNFMRQAINYFGFPTQFTNWIMTCISSPHFSILVNRCPHGYFPRK